MRTQFKKYLLVFLFIFVSSTCFYISSITSSLTSISTSTNTSTSTSKNTNTTKTTTTSISDHSDIDAKTSTSTIAPTSSVAITVANLSSLSDTHHKKNVGGVGDEQRIVILAGPHKTGTSSLQYNFFGWTNQRANGKRRNDKNATNTTNANMSTTAGPSSHGGMSHFENWIWPVPSAVAKIYSPNIANSSTLSYKAYYPLMEAIRSPKRKIPDREIFQLYTTEEIIQMFAESLLETWELGYNIIFGTEAMDLIVKLPEGLDMLNTFSERILPIKAIPVEQGEEGGKGGEGDTHHGSSGSNQITVVVTYRTPKIDHLISNWHQTCKGKDSQPFFEYITTTKNTLGVLDALGLVEIFLKYTSWNVALVDFEWVKESQWDLTSYIACHFLRVECNWDTEEIVGLDEEENPTVKNVRSSQSMPNLSDEALAEMDDIMVTYDCNYKHLFEEEEIGWKKDRLIVLHKLGIDQLMDKCRSLRSNDIYPSRVEMKEKLVQVAMKHGAKKLGL